MTQLVDPHGRPIKSAPKSAGIGDLTAKSKAVLLALGAIVAFLAAGVTNIAQIRQTLWPAGAVLQIDDIDIVDDADTPYVDIIVRNTGDKIASITSVDFQVDKLLHAPFTGGGAQLPFDEEYSVTIPLGDQLPITVTATDIRRKVEKDDVDRVRISYEFAGDLPDETQFLCAFRASVRINYNGDRHVESTRVIGQENAIRFFYP